MCKSINNFYSLIYGLALYMTEKTYKTKYKLFNQNFGNKFHNSIKIFVYPTTCTMCYFYFSVISHASAYYIPLDLYLHMIFIFSGESAKAGYGAGRLR